MSEGPPPSGRSTQSEGEKRDEEQLAAPPVSEPAPASTAAPGLDRYNALVLSLASFCLIGFVVWLVSAGSRYRDEYAQVTEGWRVGSTREVELTLVRQDKHNLACASDQSFAGLRCGYRRNSQPAGPLSPDNPQILQPYNTVGNELLLAAGLWSSPDLKGTLPASRFSVVCNYHIKGIMRAAAIRFDPAAPFGPVSKSITVGSLSDCMLPR